MYAFIQFAASVIVPETLLYIFHRFLFFLSLYHHKKKQNFMNIIFIDSVTYYHSYNVIMNYFVISFRAI